MQQMLVQSRQGREGSARRTEAFAQVVQRYQCLICALTYSATGDLDKSGDLARETFVRAFRSFDEVKDLANVREWLCRIARHVVDRSMRKQRYGVINEPPASAAWQQTNGHSPSSPVSKEHAALLWRALQPVPVKCREALVLYYRRRGSIPAAAGDLGLSEQAARELVAQGLKLLRTEYVSLVENILARTAPTRAFTTWVLDSLESPAGREQPVPQAPAAVAAGRGNGPNSRAAVGCEVEERLVRQDAGAPDQMSRTGVYAAFAVTTFGGVAWVLASCLAAADWAAAGVAAAVAVAIFTGGATLCLRDQGKRWDILIAAVFALGVLNLVLVNLRWRRWAGALDGRDAATAATDLHRWTINLVITLVLAVVLLLYLRMQARRAKRAP